MKQLQERLKRGERIILDGGVGTELEKRGVPMDKVAWSALAMQTHPDIVRQVHEDYIRAGADIITTNTFTTNRHALEQAGAADQCNTLNRRAVELAQEARDNVADRPVFIAGSISTANLMRTHPPTEAEAVAAYRDQADALAEAGVDFIMLEMVRDFEPTRHALQAVATTGLPVWFSFSCETDDDGRVMVLKRDYTLADLMAAFSPAEGTVVSIMHTQLEDTPAALAEVKKHWSGAIGAYPHYGKFVRPNWLFIDTITPQDYLTAAKEWVALGSQLIGGCCGIGPEHIRLLKEQLSVVRNESSDDSKSSDDS